MRKAFLEEVVGMQRYPTVTLASGANELMPQNRKWRFLNANVDRRTDSSDRIPAL